MQLRGKPAASIVYFGNLCTNNLFKCAYNVLSPRTATVWVKKRNERGGKKPFKCYVTTKRGGGTNRTKKKATTGTNAARRKSSSAFSVLQKSVVSTQGPVRSVETFFFLFFHPLSFSFSYKILQSGMRENNNSVSFTTGYVNTFQNQLLLKPSNKYKRKKKTFSHPSRSGNKSTPFTPQTCAMFPHAPDGWQQALRSRRNFPTQYWRKETVAQRTSPAPTRLHARLRLLVQSTARLQVACSRQEAKLISEAPLPSCHN